MRFKGLLFLIICFCPLVYAAEHSRTAVFHHYMDLPLALALDSGAVTQRAPYLITTLAGGQPPPTAAFGPSVALPGVFSNMAADSSGNIYFAAFSANVVYKLDSTGILTRFAGTGAPGYEGDDGPALNAHLWGPQGVAVDSAGNVYVGDRYNVRVRKISAGGTITTVAGNGGYPDSGDGGPATSAQLSTPAWVAVDAGGNLYIAEDSVHRIRKVNAAGIITPVAGNGARGYSGDGGPAINAQIDTPTGIAVDAAGDLYIADFGNYRIRKVNTAGTISTLAGNGSCCFGGDGAPATGAAINPYAVAVDSAGSVYTTDGTRIRKIDATSRIINTVAGSAAQGFWGDDGPALNAALFTPTGVAVDPAGSIYFVDSLNRRIRKVLVSGAAAGNVVTVAGGASGDGGPAAFAGFHGPAGITRDCDGNLYVADRFYNRVRKIAPNGVITTVAGNGLSGYAGDGGPAVNGRLSSPQGLALDASGNLYIADSYNYRVRRVAAVDGIITTVAGNGSCCSSTDGVPATSASFAPTDVALDDSGNLYIADLSNRIRKVDPATRIITTVGGNGTYGYSGDGGPATSAMIGSVYGIAVDRPALSCATPAPSGATTIYLAEETGNRIRKIAADGTISTVAGDGTFGFGGDDGPAASAQLAAPLGIALDSDGNLYIADYINERIRKVDPSGTIVTVAGSGSAGYWGDGGLALHAGLWAPWGVTVDAAGNLYAADMGNSAVRFLPAAGTLPVYTLSGTPSGSFLPGQTGASYNAIVANAPSAGPTSGTVTYTPFMPDGYSLVSLSGSGWSCTATACSRSDTLSAASSYPPIIITFNISPTAPLQSTIRGLVSGGGGIPAGASDLLLLPALTVGSATPTSGLGDVRTFNFTFSDAAGAADVSTAWMWFTPAFGSSAANTCMAYYARAGNALYLLNDDANAWMSAPLGAGTLQNSQCSLNLAKTTALASGNNLAISLALSFKSGFTGIQQAWSYAAGSGGNTGWQQVGSWTVAMDPVTAVSVTPAGGTGNTQTFTLVYSSLAGAADLSSAWVWFTANFNGGSANSCMAYYDRAANQLKLLNDAGATWMSAIIGTAGTTLQNSQCSLDVANSTAVGAGNTLTLTLPVTFKPPFAGSRGVWMYAAGDGGNSGWQQLGSWTVPTPPAPSAVSASPNAGTGSSQTFALTYSSPAGYADLTTVWVWFTPAFGGNANSCMLYYDRAANQLKLLNDAGTTWTGTTPGIGSTLQNNQCSLDTHTATIATIANNLTLNLPLSFKEAFAGDRQIWMYAASSTGNGGWQQRGSWTVTAPPKPVTVTSVTPNSGSLPTQTFALAYADTAGASDLASVWVWFTPAFGSSANSCMIYYDRAANQLKLLNDAGAVWMSATRGATGAALSNGQCSLDAANATATLNAATLTLTLPLTLQPAGALQIWMYAAGSAGNSGWQNMGSWTYFNDEIATAASIPSLPFTGSQPLAAATENAADPVHSCTGWADARTVWYRYTADFTGVLSVNTFGTNFGTTLTAYPWTSSLGSELACSAPSSVGQSAISFAVAAGQSYMIESSRQGPAFPGTPLLKISVSALQVTSLSPNTAPMNGAAFTLTVNGSGFIPGASIQWTPPGGGAPVMLAATFISPNQLQANVPATLLATFGLVQVAVLNGGSLLSNSDAFVLLHPVAAVSVTPNSGTGQSQTFQFQYSDFNGIQDLRSVWAWFTPSFGSSGANSCMFYYDRGVNQLNLLNDGGNAWMSAVRGAPGKLENSQCAIDTANIPSPDFPPTNLSLSVPLSFKAPFAGAQEVWLYAAGGASNGGWQHLGDWNALGPVAVLSVTPKTGSGATQTFSLAYADVAGAADLASVWVWFTSAFGSSGANSCMAYYDRAANQVKLLDDAGNTWLSATRGVPGTLENSQCSIDVGAATVAQGGANLTLGLPVTFKAAYRGAKQVWMYGAGGSANSDWRNMGSWTAP